MSGLNFTSSEKKSIVAFWFKAILNFVVTLDMLLRRNILLYFNTAKDDISL